MTANNFKAGTAKNTEPTLSLQITKVEEEFKRFRVVTRAGTNLVLCYNGKIGGFTLHKMCRRNLRIAGRVYNDWCLNEEETKAVKAAGVRW